MNCSVPRTENSSMTRWSRRFALPLSYLLILMTVSSCATARNPFARSAASSNRRPLLDSDRLEEERDSATAAANELREDRRLAAQADPAETTHDAATQRLIEKELKDATPEEREKFLAYLETVSPDQVPHILRSRRLARTESDSDGEKTDSPIQTASHEDAGAAPTTDGEMPRATIPPALIPSRADSKHASPKDPDALEAPSPAPSLGWQDRIKSLADPNRLWLHNSSDDDSSDGTADNAKPERGPFGLPMILGVGARTEPPAQPATPPAAPIQPLALAVPKATPQRAAETEARPTPGAAFWEDELHKLIALLEAETSAFQEAPKTAVRREDIRKQVALRMLYLIVNEPERAQQVIAGLTPAEQEYWTSIFLAVSESLDVEGRLDPADRATRTVAQLRTAANQLQTVARLQLRNLTFCERIDGFGNYAPFPETSLTPGQTVLIYGEIRNFSSEPTVDGYFRTLISSTVEISSVGPEKRLVDRTEFKATEDRCRTLRSDYYHSYRIDLPLELTPGPYLLKLTIQDELTGKLATETLSFTVR